MQFSMQFAKTMCSPHTGVVHPSVIAALRRILSPLDKAIIQEIFSSIAVRSGAGVRSWQITV